MVHAARLRAPYRHLTPPGTLQNRLPPPSGRCQPSNHVWTIWSTLAVWSYAYGPSQGDRLPALAAKWVPDVPPTPTTPRSRASPDIFELTSYPRPWSGRVRICRAVLGLSSAWQPWLVWQVSRLGPGFTIGSPIFFNLTPIWQPMPVYQGQIPASPSKPKGVGSRIDLHICHITFSARARRPVLRRRLHHTVSEKLPGCCMQALSYVM